MPLPKPKKREKEQDYISRCIKFVMDEGTTDDNKQAAAMCYDEWRDAKGIKKPKKQEVNMGEMTVSNGLVENTTTTGIQPPLWGLEKSEVKAPERHETKKQSYLVGHIHLEERDGDPIFRIPLMRKGTWKHPWYGKMEFDDGFFASLITNFDQNAVGHDLALDARHQPDWGALGWFTDVVVEDENLIVYANPTEKGLEVVPNSLRYASAEYDPDYEDAETGHEYGPTLLGAAATNRPFITRQGAITILSDEVTEEVEAEMAEGEATVVLLSSPQTVIHMVSGGQEHMEKDQEKTLETTLEEEVVEQATPEPEAEPVPPAPPSEIQLQAQDGQLITFRAEDILQVMATNRKLREERHETRVDEIITKAQRRGVPPATLRVAKPILLACSEEAEPTITLSVGDEDRKFNYFSALARLLDAIPSTLGERTFISAGEPMGAGEEKEMTTDEAEKFAKSELKRLASYMGRSNDTAEL